MLYKKRTMPRHPSDQPTQVELEILQVLWGLGPSPLGEIHQAVSERRDVAYSTTRKMVQVMREKGLVGCDENVRPQRYHAARTQEETRKSLVDDLADRAFGGSTRNLMMSLLSSKRLTDEELSELKELIENANGGEK